MCVCIVTHDICIPHHYSHSSDRRNCSSFAHEISDISSAPELSRRCARGFRYTAQEK
jgi:hypothetical protein